jgi:CubicO group peptidase (beta-lactamase class C family)
MIKLDKKVRQEIAILFAPYDRPDSPGFAVGIIHGDDFVFEAGFGQATLEHKSPITSHTVFDVGSMAKQFVGMAVALLEEDGQLSIGDPVHKYLPDFPAYAHGVTLADLLYHTSGIRNYTVLAYFMMGYHESDAISKEEVYDLLLRLKSLNFKPGERWEYSDSNYYLLAKVIEQITGKSLDQYAQEVIFKPLGMRNTRFRECHSRVIRNRATSYVAHPVAFQSPWTYRDQGSPSGSLHTLVSNYEHVGAEGLFTTLEDLYKWDRNFLANRLGKGKPDLVARVLTPVVRISEDIGYGFGINVGRFKKKQFFGHDGAIHGYTSSMMHFPGEDVSIICLANHNLEGSWEYRNRILGLIFQDGDSETVYSQTSKPQKVDPENPDIIGSYQDPVTASTWEVIWKDDHLVIRENNDREFELTFVEPLVYKAVPSEIDMTLRFEVDSTGVIRGIIGVRGGHPFRLEPFLQNPLNLQDIWEFAGEYRSEELDTTFKVSIQGNRLCFRNKCRHFCSMDLLYAPTIRDSFIAYDPHPISSQVSFLRADGQIDAFVYRDYDGDGREAIRFEKVNGPVSP